MNSEDEQALAQMIPDLRRALQLIPGIATDLATLKERHAGQEQRLRGLGLRVQQNTEKAESNAQHMQRDNTRMALIEQDQVHIQKGLEGVRKHQEGYAKRQREYETLLNRLVIAIPVFSLAGGGITMLVKLLGALP